MIANGQPVRARFLKASVPSSIDGIEKYLGSGMIRGIGPVYAKKMVEAFGEKVFDVIEAEPDRLREVTGIGAVEPNGSRTLGPSRRLSGRSWCSFTATGSAQPGRFASSRPTARMPCRL
jgi:Helix-hairpin-helix domain